LEGTGRASGQGTGQGTGWRGDGDRVGLWAGDRIGAGPEVAAAARNLIRMPRSRIRRAASAACAPAGVLRARSRTSSTPARVEVAAEEAASAQSLIQTPHS
jgi:hypothetical protein